VGAAGKKLRGHGARSKTRSPRQTPSNDTSGPVPHPRRVINGQRFAPVHGRRRRPFHITSHRKDGRVFAVKADRRKERIALRAKRLLAVDENGNGRHYRFIAYVPGRRYRTYAYIISVPSKSALLLLPDWHPDRPVRFPARLLPADARLPGAWLTCTADLGSAHGAGLNLADLVACADPGPRVCHRPGGLRCCTLDAGSADPGGAGARPRPAVPQGSGAPDAACAANRDSAVRAC
jgi:hypothetical protein